jgi:outer membrane biosynthesis protein TonB
MGYLNVMNAAGFAVLAGAIVAASRQGEGYSPQGIVMFDDLLGAVVDMNVWLPLLIALPLIFLGHTAATAKSAPAAPAASLAEKGAPAKKKAVPEKKKAAAPKRSRSKTPKKAVSAKKKSTPKKSASKKTPAKKKKRATSKTPVRSGRKSTRRRRAPTVYDASLPTDATFM